MRERIAAIWDDEARFERAYLFAFFVAFSALALVFPYSGDDWAWGSHLGVERLNTLFVDYNGRYAGNLAIFALMRMGILAKFVLAALVTLTQHLIVRVSGYRTKTGYLTVGALFVLMPLGMWRQAVAWMSGFSNYGMAAVCMLGYLAMLKRDLVAGEPTDRRAWRVLLALTGGFVSALFVEHVTLHLVIATAVGLVAYTWVHRRWYVSGTAWLVSVLAGAFVMFSNGAYHLAVSSQPHYQSVQRHATVYGVFAKAMDPIARQSTTQNWLLNLTIIALLLGLAALFVREVASSGKRGFARWAPWLVAGLSAGYLVLWRTAATYVLYPSPFALFNGFAAILLLGAIVIAALAFVDDAVDRWTILAACASIVVLIAPFALVDPVGPRCFYPSYMLLLVVVGVLLRRVIGRYSASNWMSVVNALFATLLVGALLGSGYVYARFAVTAHRRLAAIERRLAAGKTTVSFPASPFRGFVQDGEPYYEPMETRYKDYYGLPQSLKIVRKPDPVVTDPWR
jgi:hypothetical protein